ncbi:hypothetical protein [Natrinema versiforme]|uniref:Transcriptional regulator n=1 Tax=Natrinema versiforme icosahedral virus 1 TaxID=2766529 RepID=A0A7G2JUU4_9VIRU|nr:hypothetical protein [Natrinema versiforme]YP_010772675.1 transcriptional regulator [Natrinema versiforme icosahedral virus 1]DAC85259.1 TPA_asm: transcriptional regulator [Natrinema versiforme icosahedral virus 1]
MPYDARDDESGRFTPDFSDDDFLEAIEGGATTSEASDAVGCQYRTAYARLNDLEDEGRVTSRKIGNTLLWEATEPAPSDRRESAGGSPEPEPDRSPASSEDSAGGLTTTVDAVVESVASSWSDDPDRLEARKDAAKAVLEHAVESGEYVGKSDAIDRFRDEYPVEDQAPETWWRKNARDVLQKVGNYSRGKAGYRVTTESLEKFDGV